MEDEAILKSYIKSIEVKNKECMEHMCGKECTSQTILNGYIIEYKVLSKAHDGLYVGKGTKK